MKITNKITAVTKNDVSNLELPSHVSGHQRDVIGRDDVQTSQSIKTTFPPSLPLQYSPPPHQRGIDTMDVKVPRHEKRDKRQHAQMAILCDG